MKESDNLNRIQIVLIETQDGANIGSVCRAMKTMGITKLVLVTNNEYDENRVRTLALHASDIWENRTVYKTLDEALKTSIYSVGATRRRGKFRKSDYLSPEQLSDKISHMGEGLVSIVFGREASGLTDDEVNSCSQIVTIPTSKKFPSLNLSQAVQIITYNLFNNLKPYPVENTPVDKERVRLAVEGSMDNLDNIGYFKQDLEKQWTTTLLKDVYERAQLTESEIKRLEKLFYKVSKIAKYKKN
ncbi:MAG: RNA methyltransferase [Sphaerochaetaceae bacterium]|jgi:tRNA/rRNA methyltransferase|nr:RNA methyltransferase [Sphaerochaetaceae bacterium]